MAKISLRAYQREIENLIERGQTDEAIAHCKYILRYYPKHIETYRLLGKAYIESQRYSEASDILQRVLSVIPDDLVAQIGMSIVREDEGNLDAAIYHMERAFEIHPSNVAVQEELKRLYGRRDGMEPSKIRLTRGALVRMYARGELHQQATAEIRAALTEEPNRIDLEVILAKMAVLAGKKVEAVEICGRILAKLPYCAEANRLLAEILPETSRSDDAKLYQQRLIDLDPYLGYISPTTPTTNEVPENAVSLEHFDWQPSEASIDTRPQWAQAVGAEWDDRGEEAQPADWLSAVIPAAEQPITNTHQPLPTTEQPVSQDAGIPDFLQAAGWSVSEGDATSRPETQITELEQGDGLEAGELAAADMPDWLASIAPKQSDSPERTTPGKPEDDSALWLEQMMSAQSSVPPGEPLSENAGLAVITPGDIASIDVPDWLSGLTGEPPAAEVPEIEMPTDIPPVTEPESPTAHVEALPDWLTTDEAQGVNEHEHKSEIPSQDWLPETELPQVIQATLEEQSIPERLEGTDTPPSDQDIPKQATTEHLTPTEDEGFAWLEALAARQGADAGELLVATEDRRESPPDWAVEADIQGTIDHPTEKKSAESEATDFASLAGAPQQDSYEILHTAQSVSSESLDLPVQTQMDSSDDEAFAWLETLAARQGAEAGELLVAAEDRRETPPDWATETGSSESKPEIEIPIDMVAAESVAGDLAETPLTEEPIQSKPEAISAPAMDMASQAPASPNESSSTNKSEDDEAFAWLEALAARQGAEANELLVAEADRRDNPPEWAVQSGAPALDDLVPTSPLSDHSEASNLEDTQPTRIIAEPDVQSSEDNNPPQVTVIPASANATNTPDADEAFAWLEALAARQGAEAAELLVAEEDRRDAPPDWVQDAELHGPEDVNRVSNEILPLEQSDVEVQSPILNSSAPETGELEADRADTEIPVWIATPAAEEAAQTETPQSKPEGVELEATNPEEMIPDWLQGLAPSEEKPQEPVLEWLGREDGREAVGSTKFVEPREVEPTEETLASESVSVSTEDIEDAPELHRQAQEFLWKGDLKTAISLYNRLIENGLMLEEIIHDLRDALYRYPVDVEVWQTLGDAYARSNLLQEALETYTKAEELIR
jgi:tetratricopeptide (TPR) repeat protein